MVLPLLLVSPKFLSICNVHCAELTSDLSETKGRFAVDESAQVAVNWQANDAPAFSEVLSFCQSHQLDSIIPSLVALEKSCRGANLDFGQVADNEEVCSALCLTYDKLLEARHAKKKSQEGKELTATEEKEMKIGRTILHSINVSIDWWKGAHARDCLRPR